VARSRWGGLVGILFLAILALFWVFFAPVQLGGSTLYSATVGDSMEPLFHAGDLAIVRRSPSYRVGDIVLYESEILHRPVLHRIIVIQNGHYFFKGDHNTFVDPGYATSKDLLGKLWIHVPQAGSILSWFGAPSHTAILAAIAAGFLFVGGAGGGKRRRRKRRGPADRSPRQSSSAMRGVSGFIHRPRKSAENIVAAIASILAAVVIAAGFGATLARTQSVTGFHQTGRFSYSAKTLHPSTTYPDGTARSGQPIYLSVIRNVSVAFSYRFVSKLSHRVHGTVRLNALLTSDGSWRHVYTLEKTRAFTGDSARVAGTFDLRQLQALTAQISLEAGTAGANYTVQLEPIVHIAGTVGAQRIKSKFTPVLPFTLSPAVLDLSIPQTTALPGATYAPPSAAQTLATGLNPVQPGTVSTRVPNYLSVIRYHFAVSSVRGVGLALAGFALLAFLWKLLKPRREVWSHEKRIAVRYGVVLVDVAALIADTPNSRTTIVPDFESLAKLAQYCERPILRETHEQYLAYAVEDEGRLYVHRPAPALLDRTPGTVEAEAS
jgi:signal peptidase I